MFGWSTIKRLCSVCSSLHISSWTGRKYAACNGLYQECWRKTHRSFRGRIGYAEGNHCQDLCRERPTTQVFQIKVTSLRTEEVGRERTGQVGAHAGDWASALLWLGYPDSASSQSWLEGWNLQRLQIDGESCLPFGTISDRMSQVNVPFTWVEAYTCEELFPGRTGTPTYMWCSWLQIYPCVFVDDVVCSTCPSFSHWVCHTEKNTSLRKGRIWSKSEDDWSSPSVRTTRRIASPSNNKSWKQSTSSATWDAWSHMMLR